jgi:hypothetical protein
MIAATPKRRQRRLRHSRLGIPQPDDVDGRSRFARRFRKLSDEIAAEVATEVGRPLTVIERTEVQQAVTLLLRSQTEANVNAAIRLVSESRRLLEGLKPKKKGAKAKPLSPLARMLQGATP